MSKEIAIMSMQRVANYGSFLQAFALKKIIEELSGEKVEFVDFHSKQEKLRVKKIIGWKQKCKYLVYACLYKGLRIRRHRKGYDSMKQLIKFDRLFNRRFQKEFFPLLGLGQNLNYENGVDVLVIGSDEVFNYVSNEEAGYSAELIGIGNKAKKLISYSACCGYTTIERLNSMQATEKIREGLLNFSALSARDKNTLQLIETLTGRKVEYHLDPVLCYNYDQYLPKIKIIRPYIAVYAHSGLEAEYKSGIKRFAEERGLDILCFMGYQDGFGQFIEATPFEVLAYIQAASYVVSTTFHGTIFSIKYNKQLGVIVRYPQKKDGYSNSEKVGDLLDRLHMRSCEISTSKELGKVLLDEKDYTYANEYIEKITHEGKAYLKMQLE